MKFAPRILFLTPFLAWTGIAQAQSFNYLETAPVTILWNFNITGLSGTTLGSVPTPVPEGGPLAIDDADKLRPVDRITTETGNPITYTENGTQQFLVTQLIQRSIKLYNDAATQTEDEDDKAYLQKRAAYLSANASGRWELTAVRKPQTTVAGVISTPYTIFLTRIEPLKVGRPESPFLTNLTLTPLNSVGNYTETLNEGRAVKVTGSVTTHFSLVFSTFPNDIEAISALPAGTYWYAQASGYMTYSLRVTKGIDTAVLPTKVTVSGTGSWEKVISTGTDIPKVYTGTAPARVAIGEPKIQNRNLFPDFTN